jgi:hypothetical protein
MMGSHRRISSRTRERVRRRANYLCEYCHTAELWQYVQFTIDHIIPPSRGGTDSEDNFALACFHCNRHKGTHVTAVDPAASEEVALFNPRQQLWAEHFIWSADGLQIIGLTASGRATIVLLELNRERVRRIRAADVVAKRHPPQSDPIMKKE